LKFVLLANVNARPRTGALLTLLKPSGKSSMFADDTAVMAVGDTVENSTTKLQSTVNKNPIGGGE
jgi:hypothetical protein